MKPNLSFKETKKEWHGSLKSYLIGFTASIIFTLFSFGLVAFRPLTHSLSLFLLIVSALVQAAFQLVFFLHIYKEERPRWGNLVFYFMLLVLVIVVLGSLWIMFDLNRRVMDFMP